MILSAVFAILGIIIGAAGEALGVSNPFAKVLLHEIGEAGQLGLALLVAVNVIREVLKEQLEAAASTLNQTKNAIETTLAGMKTSLDERLQDIAKKIESGVRAMKLDVHLARSWTEDEVQQEFRRQLSAKAAAGDPGARVEQQIVEAIGSRNPDDWRKAESLLQQAPNAGYFQTLAYNFWKVGDSREALRLAEAGLKIATNGNDGSLTAQLKNMVAYLYAEAGLADKRDLAYRYSEDARNAWPQNQDFLETLGCVRIAFADSKEEAEEGLQICLQIAAAKRDYALATKWLERYRKRTFTVSAPTKAAEKPAPVPVPVQDPDQGPELDPDE
jgi:hypothetical protein